MGVKVTNNAFGTISAGISSSDTTVTLDTGQGARFPTLGSGDFFFGTLIDTSNNIEVVKVTARSTDSMTVTRAQDNTTARKRWKTSTMTTCNSNTCITSCNTSC